MSSLLFSTASDPTDHRGRKDALGVWWCLMTRTANIIDDTTDFGTQGEFKLDG